MTIGFNSVPNNFRVPFVSVEFDGSNAQQGTALKAYTALIMGQKLAAGTQAELELVTITSEAQARTLFGAGSHLHMMIRKWLQNQKVISLKAIAIDDLGAGVAATGDITITGPATGDGILYVWLGGQRIQVSVANGDSVTDIGDALVAAMAANPLTPFTGVNTAGVVALTAKNKGTLGNDIDIRFNYADGEEFPSGVGASVTAALSGGTGDPDIDEIIAALPEDQFDIIVNPWTDTTNLGKLETELLDRWGPIRQNDGVAFSAKLDSVGNLTTFGDARNSKHVSMLGPASGAPNMAHEWAAAYAAQVGLAGQADPARPFQTLGLVSILAPAESERFSLTERNTLLFDGISAAQVAAGDVVRIDRAITMYQENDASADDDTFLDVNTLLTLSFIRYSFRNTMLIKYPRHKLADDGTRFGPGQPVMTPSVGRAQAIELFKDWELLGLVENAEQFANDLIVERNSGDPNRLDFLLPPDLINQLRFIGAKVEFLL